MEAQVKHAMFQLNVQEYGVSACLNTPESATTFLLMVAEAVSNGFWTCCSRSTA